MWAHYAKEHHGFCLQFEASSTTPVFGSALPVGGEFVVSPNSPSPCSLAHTGGDDTVGSMRELLILAVHLLVTVAKLLRPGGVRAVAAESLLLNISF